ncbi:hypothetical protein E2986_10721 [Frieseomelitta varia]|uniref:Uncharacterized protein n=1 Tax=Frieseomelitta varia TaxID=561572 RepID=A0A833RXQ4_9HYME|nr:hypothetical protein E2986_10721 [Frieseomelitta varia]
MNVLFVRKKERKKRTRTPLKFKSLRARIRLIKSTRELSVLDLEFILISVQLRILRIFYAENRKIFIA